MLAEVVSLGEQVRRPGGSRVLAADELLRAGRVIEEAGVGRTARAASDDRAGGRHLLVERAGDLPQVVVPHVAARVTDQVAVRGDAVPVAVSGALQEPRRHARLEKREERPWLGPEPPRQLDERGGASVQLGEDPHLEGREQRLRAHEPVCDRRDRRDPVVLPRGR